MFQVVSFSIPISCKENTERISKYKEHVDKVNYNGIQFPVKLKNIPKIVNMNDIRFNVFGVTNVI